jgi:four helix bundle protein
MATVKQFEDLIAWQRARELTKFVYDISKYRNFEIDRGLQDQIRRAAVSVMSNIAEGFDRGTRQELINYFYIAKGSCGEVKSQLYIAYDSQYIDMSTFRNGMAFCDECSRLIQSFIQKVKQSAHTGLQYKKAAGGEPRHGREKSKQELDREAFDRELEEIIQKGKNEN